MQKKIYLWLAVHALFLTACTTPITPSSNQTSLDEYLKKNEATLKKNVQANLPSTPPNTNFTPLLNAPPISQPNSSLDWAPLPTAQTTNPNLNSNSNLNLNTYISPPVIGTTTSIPFFEPKSVQNQFEQMLEQDNLEGFWPAWLANCQKLGQQAKWRNSCQQAYVVPANDIAAQKQYLRQYFNSQKLDLRSAEQSKITGYYEPLLKGSRVPNQVYRYPIYQKPYNQPQIGFLQNYQNLTRQELLQSPILQGRELIYLANPVDAALIEIQGSALIELDETQNMQPFNYAYGTSPYDFTQVQNTANASKANSWIRVAFDAANQHNFKSFIQYLLNKKYITRSEMAIPNLRNWALQNPYLIQEAIQSNPRFIFFKNIEYNQGGPIGAYGLALTPQRSIAVDTNYIELGTPVIVKFNHPILGLMHRVVIAQDVGNAIKGSVRADFFWGLGEEALKLANATNAEGELTKLTPKF